MKTKNAIILLLVALFLLSACEQGNSGTDEANPGSLTIQTPSLQNIGVEEASYSLIIKSYSINISSTGTDLYFENHTQENLIVGELTQGQYEVTGQAVVEGSSWNYIFHHSVNITAGENLSLSINVLPVPTEIQRSIDTSNPSNQNRYYQYVSDWEDPLEWEYNADGMITRIFNVTNEEKYNYTQYTISGSGLRSGYLIHSYSPPSGGLGAIEIDYPYTLAHDEEGRETEVHGEDSDGIPRIFQTAEYTENGKVIKFFNIDFITDTFELQSTIEFDKMGNMISTSNTWGMWGLMYWDYMPQNPGDTLTIKYSYLEGTGLHVREEVYDNDTLRCYTQYYISPQGLYYGGKQYLADGTLIHELLYEPPVFVDGYYRQSQTTVLLAENDVFYDRTNYPTEIGGTFTENRFFSSSYKNSGWDGLRFLYDEGPWSYNQFWDYIY